MLRLNKSQKSEEILALYPKARNMFSQLCTIVSENIEYYKNEDLPFYFELEVDMNKKDVKRYRRVCEKMLRDLHSIKRVDGIWGNQIIIKTYSASFFIKELTYWFTQNFPNYYLAFNVLTGNIRQFKTKLNLRENVGKCFLTVFLDCGNNKENNSLTLKIENLLDYYYVNYKWVEYGGESGFICTNMTQDIAEKIVSKIPCIKEIRSLSPIVSQ